MWRVADLLAQAVFDAPGEELFEFGPTAVEHADFMALLPDPRGSRVLDLGCGSGVLSFMACEAGAGKVYAIEGGPVIDVARELAADNGFADRIEFLSGWSMEVGIPEPADVLISETIGNPVSCLATFSIFSPSSPQPWKL